MDMVKQKLLECKTNYLIFNYLHTIVNQVSDVFL